MASMSVEMAAARLLAPYFGTSLYIWGILIGLVLAYLTAGYWLGGRLADARPRRRLFYGVNAAGAVAVAAVGLLATPVLTEALLSTAGVPYGLFIGALAGCIALFAVPIIVLGAVNPFAIRLSVSHVAASGNVAGAVFALTTIGSLIGTFGAVFLFIPSIGTRATLYVFAGALFATACGGLLTNRATDEER